MKVSYTKNKTDKTYTVKVDGVEIGTCKDAPLKLEALQKHIDKHEAKLAKAS